MEKYKADYEELQSQIVDIAPKVQKNNLAVLKEFLQGDFEEVYDTLSIEGKQALWRTIIKEIRVSGKDITDIKFI